MVAVLLKRRFFGLLAAGVLAGAVGLGAAWYAGLLKPDSFHRAQVMMDKGNYRDARVELRSALLAQPNNPAVRLAMARVLARLADPVAAERELRLAAGAGADKWEIWPELGEALIAQRKFKELLAQIPATAPDPAVAARDLALRAAAQVALGDLAAAQRSLDAVNRVAPGSIEAMLIEARLAAARNDLAGTEKSVAAVLQRDPKQVEALLMREQLLTGRRDYAAALAVATQAVEAAPWSAMARIDRAYQLMFNNQDAKAQEDVDTVLANQPQFIDGIYLKGILKARRGDMDGAGVELARLENAGSRFPQALLYLAKVSRAQGRKEAAAEQARRYNVLVPTDLDGVKMVAQTDLDIGRPALAIPIVQAALARGQSDAELLDLSGRLYVATGANGPAFAAFQQAAVAAPDDAGIAANLGMATMRRSDFPAAAAELERSLKLNPKLDEAAESLVLAYIKLGDTDKAQVLLDTLRGRRGDTAVLAILTSELQARQGNTVAARATLTASSQKFPDSVPVRMALARRYAADGLPGQAIRVYQDVLAKQPANAEALESVLPMLVQAGQAPLSVGILEAAHKAQPAAASLTAMLADAYTANGSPKKALALLEDNGTKDAASFVLMPPLARAQAAAGLNDQARGTYSAIMKARPGDLATRLDQVAFLTAQNEKAAAEASLRDAVVAAPGDMIPMTDLVSYVNRARGTEAALQVIEQLKANPVNMPYAGALKGDLLMRINRFADAAAAYQAEFQAAPAQPLLLRYAAAAGISGRDDLAAQALRSWLQTHPDELDAAAMLARIDISTKRWAEAEAMVKLVLDKVPNDPLALTSLARIYLGTNDKRALDVAQRAYLASPSPQTGDTLGWVLTWQGDVKAAIPLLRLASQQSPGDAAIRYHLAVALNKDGKRDEAVPILLDVTKASTPFDEQADAITLLKKIGPA